MANGDAGRIPWRENVSREVKTALQLYSRYFHKLRREASLIALDLPFLAHWSWLQLLGGAGVGQGPENAAPQSR